MRVVGFHTNPVKSEFRFDIFERVIENFLLLPSHGNLLDELVRLALGLLGMILYNSLKSLFASLTRHTLAVTSGDSILAHPHAESTS